MNKICRKILMASLLLSFISVGQSFSCDSGTLSGTCNITSSQSVTGESISGEGELVVRPGGTLSTGAGSGSTASLDFEAVKIMGTLRGNFDIEAEKFNLTSSGEVNADGKGYDGGRNPCDDGYGPGAGGGGGGGSDKRGGGGAGYGGSGQDGESMNNGGSTYGSASEPERLGSGGGAGGENGCNDGGDEPDGGRGGGSIKINTTVETIIKGTITADGNNGYDSSNHGGGGGGSGGSVWILTSDLKGTGSISARAGVGGDKTDAGGGDGGHGGGGRISLYYQNNYASLSKDVWGANSGTKYINSSYEPPVKPFCDVETAEKCEISSEKSVSSKKSIGKDLVFKESSKVVGSDAVLSVAGILSILGTWEGSVNSSAREVVVRPGASFRPGSSRIILDE